MRTIQLRRLKPGRRFRVPETGQEGTLLAVSDCWATVKTHGEPIKREFETRNGKTVEFTVPGGKIETWAPTVSVMPVI